MPVRQMAEPKGTPIATWCENRSTERAHGQRKKLLSYTSGVQPLFAHKSHAQRKAQGVGL